MSDESRPSAGRRARRRQHTPDDIIYALSGMPDIEAKLLDWHEAIKNLQTRPTLELSEAQLLTAMRLGRGFVRLLAAGAGNIYTAVADVALVDRSYRVRIEGALSTNATPSALEQAAVDPSPFVRLAVSSNTSLPIDALVALLDEPEPLIQQYAAQQHRLPPNVLERLSHSDDPVVQNAIASDPRAPASALHRLAEKGCSAVWQILVANPATPTASLELLPAVVNPHLHAELIKHPNATDGLCRRLAVAYLDEPEAPLRLAGLRLLFRGSVKVAPWGEGNTSQPAPAFERPSELLCWLADGADLSTVVPYALDTSWPEWVRWFIVSRCELDHDTWVRLATDTSERIRQHAINRLRGPQR